MGASRRGINCIHGGANTDPQLGHDKATSAGTNFDASTLSWCAGQFAAAVFGFNIFEAVAWQACHANAGISSKSLAMLRSFNSK